ncbi:MAG: ABC transporter permease [Myxococcota bacterium]|nr:ABC transporter permease [Myxococcota bacterium]
MLTLFRMAWRNIGRNPRRTGILLTTVAVGMLGTVLSMAIMWGMMAGMVDTAIQTDLGHIQIHAEGYEADPAISLLLSDGGSSVARTLDRLPSVVAHAPRLRSEALVSSPTTSVGLRLLGVDAQREPSVSSVKNWIIEGRFLSGEAREAVVGRRLAERLDIEIGDKIVISAQDTQGDMTAESARIRGIFESSSADFDKGSVFINLKQGAKLLGTGSGITEIVVMTTDRDQVDLVQEELVSSLPQLEVRSWTELQPFVAFMIESSGAAAASLYLVIFVAMAFGIANVMMMSIFDRIREIGVMLALGMSRARLLALIILEGILVTTLGTAIGLGLAAAIVLILSGGIDFSIFADGLNEMGAGALIIPQLNTSDFIQPIVISIFTALIASIWPALRAIRLQPAEATRQN